MSKPLFSKVFSGVTLTGTGQIFVCRNKSTGEIILQIDVV